MSKALTSTIESQISSQRIGREHTFKLNSVDRTSVLQSWNVSFDTQFGSASASFTLINDDGIFGDGGTNEINVGDIVELIENYTGDSTDFASFYGRVEQRSIDKTQSNRTITLTCLDYIATLKNWDVNLVSEGTKVEVTNETLTPNYLPSPNHMFAQVFDFANDAIAQNPLPILTFRNKDTGIDDPQYDGMDISYQQGQVKLGAPLNALSNHDLVAKSYYFYTVGVFVEDVIEELLTQPDNYGGYLFGESTAQDVIDNHLKTTFQDEDGAGVLDYLVPNYTATEIEIRTALTSAYTALAATISCDTQGLPDSGQAEVNGEYFTWTSKDTTTLYGIPASGEYSMGAHPSGALVKYETTYATGRVWSLEYNNISSTLTSANFTIPGATFTYMDARNGRIILDSAISLTAQVRCNYNYEFKTIQATQIELNKILFRPREVKNRFDAISKVRQYLAPNYIIRTQGDSKIWSSYMRQNVNADYTLNLMQNATYMEDSDLYTRVKFFVKNVNPTNVMFDEAVDFVDTGESYKGYATQNVLTYDSDADEEGWHLFKTSISDAGYITSNTYQPIVYINGVPIDNTLHRMIAQPILGTLTTRTETTTTTDKGGSEVESRTYYKYKIQFGHQSIEASQSIILYNATGTASYNIDPNDSNMDYGRGIYYVPGEIENTVIESLATATYWVMYATKSVEIDYDNVTFKINNTLLPDPSEAEVSASYEYYTVFTAASGLANIIDGRWDTQVQTEFFSSPPAGYNYAIIDLGQTRNLQAIDIVSGFYRPDEYRKYETDVRFTLHYSLNGTDYFNISDQTHNVAITGGEAQSFEESELGTDLEARYLKVILENVKKIDFGDGVYPVAFAELSVYTDIILSSNATLIATTALTDTASEPTLTVSNTDGFTEPGSGETDTAYIFRGTEIFSFTYTGLTSTTFTGVDFVSGTSGVIGDRVAQELEGDTTLYDDDNLRQKLGDRLFKQVRISDQTPYSQENIDRLSKAYLEEFYKDHSKISVNVLFSPYLKVGNTVAVTDSYNNVSDENYFIESIQNSSGNYKLTLAKYPS